MEIPPLWKEILTKVQTIYPEAIIAGGCLRDLDHGKEPKDIDIFVEELTPPSACTNVGLRLFELKESKPPKYHALAPLGFSPSGNTTFYFHQGADQVAKFKYRDFPVEIVEMKGAYTPWSVLNRFDFGLNRIAWDGENFYVSDYYAEDKTNKTCTLRSACNQSHYEFLLTEKWEKRLQLKYPELTLVIPDDFKRKYKKEV